MSVPPVAFVNPIHFRFKRCPVHFGYLSRQINHAIWSVQKLTSFVYQTRCHFSNASTIFALFRANLSRKTFSFLNALNPISFRRLQTVFVATGVDRQAPIWYPKFSQYFTASIYNLFVFSMSRSIPNKRIIWLIAPTIVQADFVSLFFPWFPQGRILCSILGITNSTSSPNAYSSPKSRA